MSYSKQRDEIDACKDSLEKYSSSSACAHQKVGDTVFCLWVCFAKCVTAISFL